MPFIASPCVARQNKSVYFILQKPASESEASNDKKFYTSRVSSSFREPMFDHFEQTEAQITHNHVASTIHAQDTNTTILAAAVFRNIDNMYLQCHLEGILT